MSEGTEQPQEAEKAANGNPTEMGDVSLVYDVPVTLNVQLGEGVLTIGDLLKCGKGSVIPLSQKVGDPFVVMLQKRAIAEGEIVEAGGHLGIKITNVIKVSET